jgi:N,N-dimethylformamidase
MKLLGYSSALSVQPEETLAFKVSSEFATYSARIVRLIHGDDRPGTPGFKCEHVPSELDGDYPGEVQRLHLGSFIHIPYRESLELGDSFTVEMWIWPTMPEQARGVLLSQSGPGGFALSLEAGRLTFETGQDKVTLQTLVQAGTWYRVTAAFDRLEGQFRLTLAPQSRNGSVPGDELSIAIDPRFGSRADFAIGAELSVVPGGRLVAVNVFNGKIDAPKLYRRAVLPGESHERGDVMAAWDFSIGIDSWDVTDVSGNGHHGRAVNQPMRGATGHNWDGSETAWRHAPHQYGAIHFHDDDLSDAGWKTSLEWAIPRDLRSAVYALHISPVDAPAGDADDDYIPFFVRPRRGTRQARIALLMPTFTYMAYANERILQSSGADPEAAFATQKEDRYIVAQRLLSLYDMHSDGSGVCYSSRLRPILNMRPRVLMQYLAFGRGAPHGLNADLFLVDWLEHFGFEFDVMTDEDLHKEGAGLLAGYKTVIIPTHSEYWSFQMIQEAQSYLRAGGRMLHLSGNGMYWVTQFDHASASSIEVRRGGRGSGLWAAAPGEEYLSSTGELGGIWRYRGHAPQTWLGIGTTAETPGPGRPYARQPDSFDPRAGFIFAGVGEDEAIGDFPNLIQDYGAAGYEIDRADSALGTPSSALILATASGFSDDAQVVAEQISYMDALQSRATSPLVRCDMVLLDYPHGGAVFAVGSVAWCGALSYNGYENNVSRITHNVLSHFAGE